VLDDKEKHSEYEKMMTHSQKIFDKGEADRKIKAGFTQRRQVSQNVVPPPAVTPYSGQNVSSNFTSVPNSVS
jgi:hypothetical protein